VFIEVGVRSNFRPRDIVAGTIRDEAEPLELCKLLKVNRPEGDRGKTVVTFEARNSTRGEWRWCRMYLEDEVKLTLQELGRGYIVWL
jgi:hypothetical protein